MEDEALADISDRLYGGSLDDFVAARTAAAKDVARQDKELAAAVRALPKPSVAAWALNMLARYRPDVLAGLGGLGVRMRAAQDSLDAPALRELGRERRTMLADAVDIARSVAQEQGRTISDVMAADVEETLRALTADERAAAAVGSGRLLKVLSADGINDVDLDGAVALPGLLPAAPATRRVGAPPAATQGTAPKGAAAKAAGPKAAGRKATAAKTRTTAEHASQPKPAKPRLEAVRQAPRPASPPALERAKAALAEARAAEEDASRLAGELQDQEEQTRAEIAELQQETAELRNRLKAAEESLDRSRKRLAATSAEAKQAVRAADKASRTAMLAQERVLRLASS
ncbi:hypothetical protein [Pseudarthrobacter sp. BRE9]|uniref:hypothetical protein n=1 Tax=Pseudarthrobacter sp. BRE9 TaxID=2962582 RepID=UPI002881C466|nr:hypothetical protein [Pseudarthrobacter sp. BRE9]MDT0171076.1 hypothetical protein [Pseudarthrobacter sp. BRE9]